MIAKMEKANKATVLDNQDRLTATGWPELSLAFRMRSLT
jgi:hypothetical protein